MTHDVFPIAAACSAPALRHKASHSERASTLWRGISRGALFAITLWVCGFAQVKASDTASTKSAGETSGMLSVERIYDVPALSGAAPIGLKISPDGKRLTFLRGTVQQAQVLDLWQYDIARGKETLLVAATSITAGQEQLSDEEKARRERQRIASLQGIVEYFFSDDGSKLLFPVNGALYLHTLRDGKTTRITDPEKGAISDPKFSPKGSFVSFVRQQNVYAIALKSGEEIAITQAGLGTVSFGVAEFVAQEEMDRFTGYWWSPDEQHIAVQRIDEAMVPIAKRFEIYADRTEIIEQRYPKAGARNVESKLFLITLAKPDLQREIPLQTADIDAADFYLARVQWVNAERLSFQLQSRNQQRLALMQYTLASGSTSTLLQERSDTYVSLHDQLHFLQQPIRGVANPHPAPAFLWSSEASGFQHLELRAGDGQRIAQLTQGAWEAESLLAVDAKRGFAYLAGNREEVHQRHIYRLDIAAAAKAKSEQARDQALVQISRGAGTHQAVFARDASTFVDSYSDILTPPQVRLHRADGAVLALIEANTVDAKHPLHSYRAKLVMPEYGSFDGPAGALSYRIFKPANFRADKKYPALVYTYGGPSVQVLQRQWDGRWGMLMQYFAQQGYIVFNVDNRGSSRRGKAFESAIYRQMGGPDVADQLSGVRWLAAQPFVDAKRIGVMGWSYGGFMSLHMLTQGGDLLRAGAAGAPVTDWSLYDTHYTERYMDLPESNVAGYTQGMVSTHLKGLKGRLFLVHGMADDNVLFLNSTQLMSQLQQSGIAFELMTYPGMKHGPSDNPTRRHVFGAIADFFARELKPESP
jgi:dipeptidyl-peptidase 4